MSSFFDRERFRRFSNIWMTLLLCVSLIDHQISQMCEGWKEGSETHRNVTLEMSSLWVSVKRSRGKEQKKKTEKHQHAILAENNLCKGFTTDGVWNYDQRLSGNVDSGVSWNSSSWEKFLNGRTAVPFTVTIKLSGLLLALYSNIFCSKTFK